MDTINQFLEGSDVMTNVVLAVITLVGLITARFLNSHAITQVKASKFAPVFDALCAGVATTYNTYVRDIKAAAADGKLTKEEIRIANRNAVKEALKAAKDGGTKRAIAAMTEAETDRWIAKAVGLLKEEGGKQLDE